MKIQSSAYRLHELPTYTTNFCDLFLWLIGPIGLLFTVSPLFTVWCLYTPQTDSHNK